MLDWGEMFEGITVSPTFELSFLLSVLGVGSGALVVISTNLLTVISVVTPSNSSFGIGLGIEIIGLESSYQHSAFQPPSHGITKLSLTTKFWKMKAVDAKNMKSNIPYWMTCLVRCKLDFQCTIC